MLVKPGDVYTARPPAEIGAAEEGPEALQLAGVVEEQAAHEELGPQTAPLLARPYDRLHARSAEAHSAGSTHTFFVA